MDPLAIDTPDYQWRIEEFKGAVPSENQTRLFILVCAVNATFE